MATFDFVTYGGFDIIVKALTGISLMFSDQSWGAIYWALAAFAMMVYFFLTYMTALSNGVNPGIVGWAKTFFWAIILWAGLISPLGTLIVYDAQTNKMQSVGGLPLGVVLIAGITNKIEVGLIDIVDTAMNSRIKYANSEGGKGLDMLSKLYGFTENELKWTDDFNRMSLARYFTDCVVFYTITGDISVDGMKKDTDLFTNTFSQAQSDGVYTVYYSSGSKSSQAGVTKTCREAYTSLKSVFTSAYFMSMFQGQFCTSQGYSRDDPTQLTKCQNTFYESLQTFLGSNAPDPEFALLQMHTVQVINNYVLSNDNVGLAKFVADRQIGTGMIGVGIMANEFIPIFKNVMTAIAILITPILFLFFASHAKSAFSYFMGTFVWLMMWGVMDAVLHSFAMDYAYTVFTNPRDYPLSYSSALGLDVTASRIMGILGYMRFGGLFLSSSITFGVLLLGGKEFASMGGSMQGKIEGAGETAGKVELTPEGQSEYVSRLDQGIATSNFQRGHSFNNRVSANQYAQEQEFAMRDSVVKQIGGGDPVKAGQITGGWNAASQAGHIGRDIAAAQQLGFLKDLDGDGKITQLEADHGMTEFKKFEDGDKTLSWGMAQHVNQMTGKDVAQEGMKLDYGVNSETGLLQNMTLSGRAKYDDKEYDTKIQLGQDGSIAAYSAMRSIQHGGEDIGGKHFTDGTVQRYQDGREEIKGTADGLDTTMAYDSKSGQVISSQGVGQQKESLALNAAQPEGKKRLEEMRDFWKAERHNDFANAVDGVIKSGETASFDITRDQQGRMGMVNMSHGGKSQKFDFASFQDGKEYSYKNLTTREEGNKDSQYSYNKIHEGADGKSYRIMGNATTFGSGKDAITQVDLRGGIMQEVDKQGNVIGEKYSAGAAIQGGKIINMEAERGTEIAKKQKTSEEYGSTGQYHLGADNIRGGGFKVAGMNFVAADVSKSGDQFTIVGTNHLGYKVIMEGISKDGVLKDDKGKFVSIPDFEATNIAASKTRDTLVSKYLHGQK